MTYRSQYLYLPELIYHFCCKSITLASMEIQTASTTNAGQQVVVGVIVWFLSVIIYRRYLSPLSNIPGPFWASFSRLWHLHITIQGNQNEQLTKAHEKYGHFVRLANNEVSVSHPDSINRVLLATLEKVLSPLVSDLKNEY